MLELEKGGNRGRGKRLTGGGEGGRSLVLPAPNGDLFLCRSKEEKNFETREM